MVHFDSQSFNLDDIIAERAKNANPFFSTKLSRHSRDSRTGPSTAEDGMRNHDADLNYSCESYGDPETLRNKEIQYEMLVDSNRKSAKNARLKK